MDIEVCRQGLWAVLLDVHKTQSMVKNSDEELECAVSVNVTMGQVHGKVLICVCENV